MANPRPPVATTTTSTHPHPTSSRPPKPQPTTNSHPHCQWSPLPTDIEDHFGRMDQHLHGLALTFYRFQKVCPLVKSTPDIRALMTKVESLGGMMKEAVREMHDKMSIPFQVSQPAFQEEMWQTSEIELRPGVQVSDPSPDSTTDSESEGTPEEDKASTTAAATSTCARFRGQIPRVPRVVKRHGPADLAKTLPYSLQVRDVPGSAYASWHIPYKVVFTPDEKMVDEDGKPLPAILVDVDEHGVVKYVWKNGTLDEETEKVMYVDEEPCVVEPKQDLRSKMIRRVTLVPHRRISKTRTGRTAGKPQEGTHLTSADIYSMGGRIMSDFLQVTHQQAVAAAGRKRKRGDTTDADSPGPETTKRQRTIGNRC